jgi:outer membrane protein TolC
VGNAADEPIAGNPPAFNVDAEHLRAHVHEHPELAVFVPMTQMAQAEVHEAEAMKRPDWGIELSYGDRGAEFSDMVSMQFTLGLPLFTGTRQNPQIAARRAELARVENEREAMLLEHTDELESQLAEYGAVTRQLVRLREIRMALAQDKVRYQFASYRAGKTDLTNVLAARRELIDQQLKEVELQATQSATGAKLYFTYGEGAINAEVTR